MASAVIDWIRLSPRWTAVLTPDRQRALAALSAADQQAFFDQVAKGIPQGDDHQKRLSDPKAFATAAPHDLVEKTFAAANRHFDEFAKSKGIKIPDTMMLA
jgi:hypothetical protein